MAKKTTSASDDDENEDDKERANSEDNENENEGPELPPVIDSSDAFNSFNRRVVTWVSQPDAFGRGGEPRYAPEDLQDFRPCLRPPVPVLTLLDDGSMEHGEDVRMRRERLAIGRTSGDVQIPNDPAISGAHAEIRRTPWRGAFQWHLHDLDSVNGTFVRCVRAVLYEHAILILGARRFRLRNPLKPNTEVPSSGETSEMEGVHIPRTVWPVLAEASAKSGALECPLRSDKVTIGRTGGGADIELDDPLLAYRHAELNRMRDGTWLIKSETTRNGMWVSISAVGLTSTCYFRCGEQRFRFVIP
jgi:pSer/pThr/pTyr-binding forkhead associated (FHA) protein